MRILTLLNVAQAQTQVTASDQPTGVAMVASSTVAVVTPPYKAGVRSATAPVCAAQHATAQKNIKVLAPSSAS